MLQRIEIKPVGSAKSADGNAAVCQICLRPGGTLRRITDEQGRKVWVHKGAHRGACAEPRRGM